jgi:hypothetical protein
MPTPQIDRCEPASYQWQSRRHSGSFAVSDSFGCLTVVVLMLTSFFSSCPSGPHRLATVDEPGWRAQSASLDAERQGTRLVTVTVPIIRHRDDGRRRVFTD